MDVQEKVITRGPVPALSCVLPARDEAEGIGRALGSLHEGLTAAAFGFEIIVVDDASRDGTRRLVESFAATRPGVRVMGSPRPHGYGTAIRAGFGAARGEVIGYTDADLPVSPHDIAAAAQEILDGNADAVFGVRSRHAEGGAYRRAQSAAWNAICRRVLGIDSPDVNFSLKVLRRDLLRSLALESRRNFIDAELYLEVRRRGRRLSLRRCDPLLRVGGRSSLGGPVAALTCLAEACAHVLARGRR